MVVSETNTYIGTLDGYIIAFERDTGRYAWHHRPRSGTGMGSYLMTVNGRLYYTDMTFRLYCLEEEEPTDPVLRAQRGEA
jgi:outer membrane protein assembly factor BamB